jgi:hypothetical protein
MKLRESIAYNKDLITGEENFLIKQKPIVPVKGTVKLELFDALTGKKTYEAKTENIINSIVSKYAFMDYFYGKIKGDRGISYYAAPFQYMVLTDYKGIEDAEIEFYKGNLVGYGDKTTAYSGPDTLRGTINLAESNLDLSGNGLVHFVFDFPTHAANGTFESLWWVNNLITSPSKKRTITVQCPCTRTDGGATGTGNYPGFVLVRTADKWIAIIGENSSTVGVTVFYQKYALVLNDDFSFYKYIDLSGKLSSAFVNAFCGWGSSETDLIIYNGYVSSNNIAVINIETEQIKYITCNAGDYGSPYISANIRNNKLYICGNKFAEYSINGGTTTFIKDNGSCVPYFFTDYNKGVGFLNSSSTICFIENGAVKVTPVTINSNSLLRHIKYSPNDSDVGYVLESFLQNGTTVTLTIGEYSIGTQVGAQTLLASSVTKMPTNTMKIQYDFQIEKVL